MENCKKVTAILLAAGKGTRFGAGYNKVFVEIKQKPIIYYSIKAFLNHKDIDELIIVINEEEKARIEKIIKEIKHSKNIIYIQGGDTRQQSVYNGLKEAKGEIAIIHDGARPMITDKYINRCIEEMKTQKGVTIGVKSKDTIKVTDDNEIVQYSTKRENTWIIQTPQCFDKQTLLQLHMKYKNNESITDDCMLLELEGIDIKLIQGDYINIKVTTKEDIKIIEEIIK